jgi:hypothetical protein
MKQERLPLSRPMQDVDILEVRRQPTMSRALVLCAALGGFENDKDFCRQIDLDPGVWSLIQSGTRYFPHDRYEQLFDVCGNEAPLAWLADRRGYVLVPKETEMQRRLRLANESLDEERKKSAVLLAALQGRAV